MHVLFTKLTKKSGIWLSIGKMIKHREMQRHPLLRSHLPETHWITGSRTVRMLKTYSSIFIKPNHGSGGSGIIRAKQQRNEYEVRCGASRKIVRAGSQDLFTEAESTWIIAGMAARVAAPNNFVANYLKGGPKPLIKYLQQCLGTTRQK